jgi:hypothetical protein
MGIAIRPIAIPARCLRFLSNLEIFAFAVFFSRRTRVAHAAHSGWDAQPGQNEAHQHKPDHQKSYCQPDVLSQEETRSF